MIASACRVTDHTQIAAVRVDTVDSLHHASINGPMYYMHKLQIHSLVHTHASVSKCIVTQFIHACLKFNAQVRTGPGRLHAAEKMAYTAGVLPFGSSTPPAPLWSGGPSLGQFYSFPGRGVSSVGPQLPVTRTRFEFE